MKTREIVKTLEDTVEEIFKHYACCSENLTLIIGVSGGPDSMALLYALKKISIDFPLKLIVAHVNHKTRNGGSDLDEELVKKTAKKLMLSCEVETIDVKEYGKARKLSFEEAGREVRKTFFFRLKEQYAADYIVTAHHRDDNVETMLFNLIRGTSVKGLSGMPIYSREMLRPLLDFSKKEILEYCKWEKIPYRTDETNFDTSLTRNRIRHNIIPEIEKINPDFRSAFHEKSFYFGEIDEMLNYFSLDFTKQFCQVSGNEIGCPVGPLRGLMPTLQKSVIQLIYEMLHGSTAQLSSAQIEDFLRLIRKDKTGTEKILGKRMSLSIAYGRARFQKEKTLEKPHLSEEKIPLPLPGSIVIPGGKIVTRIHNKIPKKTKKNAVYVSLRQPDSKFFIRGFKDGDRFHPKGMEGSKKVQDFFVDKKIRRDLRKNVPIIIDACDNIVAVGHLRIDKSADPNLFESPVIEIQILENEQKKR
jgi:tRNA(Ile)-lysidine synthase